MSDLFVESDLLDEIYRNCLDENSYRLRVRGAALCSALARMS
jgi:hypothetical protein